MMEVCGGQTHSIIRHGIDQLLPSGVELVPTYDRSDLILGSIATLRTTAVRCLGAGTGAEVTPFAVITDPVSGQKYPLADVIAAAQRYPIPRGGLVTYEGDEPRFLGDALADPAEQPGGADLVDRVAAGLRHVDEDDPVCVRP